MGIKNLDYFPGIQYYMYSFLPGGTSDCNNLECKCVHSQKWVNIFLPLKIHIFSTVK